MQDLEQISKIIKLCKEDGIAEFYNRLLSISNDKEIVYSKLLEVLKLLNLGDLMDSSLKDITLILDDILNEKV